MQGWSADDAPSGSPSALPSVARRHELSGRTVQGKGAARLGPAAFVVCPALGFPKPASLILWPLCPQS